MKKELYDNIFETATKYRKNDQLLQKSLNAFCGVISPSSHNLVFDNTQLDAYLAAIRIFTPEMADHLDYYFYEASNMDNPICTCQGKKYNAKDYEEYYQFFNAINK